MAYKKAERRKKKLRGCLVGPSGSGKTISGLLILRGLVGPTGKLGVLDTEHGSASLYADDPDIGAFEHDELTSFSPDKYIESLNTAARLRIEGLLIDSLSHAWAGKDGILEFVDKNSGTNKFVGWRAATPKHNLLVETLLSYPGHLIVTLRAKTTYQLITKPDGKTEVRKIGLQPIQRDGVEYEFDFIGDMEAAVMTCGKGRVGRVKVPFLRGAEVTEPGIEFGITLREWLDRGAEFVQPEMPRQFTVAGQTITTKGLLEETYIELRQLARLYEGKHGNGSAAKVLKNSTGKVLLNELTQAEGLAAKAKFEEVK